SLGNRKLRLNIGHSKAASLPTMGSGDTACPPLHYFIPRPWFPLAKEKTMIRLVVFVAVVVIGAVGTLVVQHPSKVAHKVREVAALAMKKIRDVYQAGEPKDEKPGERPADRAA